MNKDNVVSFEGVTGVYGLSPLQRSSLAESADYLDVELERQVKNGEEYHDIGWIEESVRLSKEFGWDLRDSYNLIGKSFQDMHGRTPEQWWEDCRCAQEDIPDIRHPKQKRKCFSWSVPDAEYFERFEPEILRNHSVSNDNEYDHGLER